MLIRFNVRNFLSFNTTEKNSSEEFSMIAGKVRSKKDHVYDDGKIKLLKFAAIYGANASGKSNVVKAMNFMQYTVVAGLPKGHTEQYCKTDPENRDKPSYFEMEILLNKKYYAYGFEVILSQSKFISEWLIELKEDNSEKVLFERDIEKGTYLLGSDFKEKGLYEKMEVYAGDIREDSTVLFLYIMNQNKKNLYDEYKKARILRRVFRWIQIKLDINYPNQPISDYSYLAKADNVEQVCKMISAFGTGITNFTMVDVPLEKVMGNIPKEIQQHILSDIENKQAEIMASSARQIANLCFSLKADEKYLQGQLIPARQDSDAPDQSENVIVQEIESACDLTDIDSLKIIRMDLATPENQQSEAGKSSAIKNAHTYGADMWSDYCVLYEYNGQTYMGGMTFYQYGDQWYINTLNTIYGNQTIYGYLIKMNEDEYLDAVNGGIQE